MKTSKPIVMAAMVVVAVAACRKDVKQQPLSPVARQNQAALQPENLKPVPQKMYNVSGKEALAIVKKFKGLEENTAIAQGRLIEADSVALDSSVFVVEGALNYDFDYHHPDPGYQLEDLPMDTTEYTIPISSINRKVSSNELEEAYGQLTAFVESQLSTTVKVKVIDLEAYISEDGNGIGQVTYRALLIRHYVPAQMYWCGTNTSGGYATNLVNYTPHAKDIILYYLRHCDFPLSDCPNSFYINNQTIPYDNISNSYSSGLHYKTFSPPVLVDQTFYTAAQVNSFRAGCTYIVQNALNSMSPAFKVTACDINYNFLANVNPYGITKAWWVLYATYSIPVTINC